MQTRYEELMAQLDGIRYPETSEFSGEDLVQMTKSISVQLEGLRTEIYKLPDNQNLVEAYNQRVDKLLSEARILAPRENESFHEESTRLLQVRITPDMLAANPPQSKTKAKEKDEINDSPFISKSLDSTEQQQPKNMVYTPLGMRKAFREWSKQLEIKNRISKIKDLSAAINVMNDGREQRKQPPIEVPFMDQPAMQKADYSLLEKEIKYVKRMIEALNDLKAHQPDSHSSYNEKFITDYNKFAAGINHHLKGMLKAANNVDGAENLQREIEGLMQQKLTHREELMVEVRASTVDTSLPEFHQTALRIGLALDDRLNKDAKLAAHAELKSLLENESVNINAVDASDNTILHLAVEAGLVGLTRYLLENTKIDIDILNGNDERAIDIARAKANIARREFQQSTGTHDKSESKFTTILNMLSPAARRETAKIEKERASVHAAHYKKESLTSIFNKYLQSFTKLNKNVSTVDFAHIPYLSVNKNYLHHEANKKERMNYSSFGKFEATKVANPLYAINTALTMANLGARILVDKAATWMVNRFSWMSPPPVGNSGPIATILKGILTVPISIAETVIGGVADLISLGINTIADAARKPSKNVSSQVEPIGELTSAPEKSASSTFLATSKLGVNPTVTAKQEASTQSAVSNTSKPAAEKPTKVAESDLAMKDDQTHRIR